MNPFELEPNTCSLWHGGNMGSDLVKFAKGRWEYGPPKMV